MSFKCVHIADIHFRGLSRHDEYRQSFTEFFNQAKALSPDVIFVGGDIVHSKTQGISPELIDLLSWWFTSLADIAPTHIILGNHDGLIMNKHRQDAITPIITALDNPRLHLYKKSGTYPTGVDGFNWCVFSCFDEPAWNTVKPVSGETNIALFHGGVTGSLTDINWNIDGEVDVEFFNDFDFVFLGDIHRVQYLNKEKTVAYCGSSIQQNYGEDPGKGFLFWEIESKETFTSTFHEIPHSVPFVTVDWKGTVELTMDEADLFPDGSRFRIRVRDKITQADIRHLHSSLKESKDASEIVFKHEHDDDMSVITTSDGSIFKEDLRDPKTHMKIMRDFYNTATISGPEWDRLDNMISVFVNKVSQDEHTTRHLKWTIRRLEFDNTFSYGKGNVINFDALGGITGVFGKNRSGKSSIPGTLMYTLFNTTDRGPIKNIHIINSRKGHCSGKLLINVNGKNYIVERQSVKHQNRRGVLNASTHLNLFLADDDGDPIQDLSEEQRRETEKVLRRLVGNADDFLLTSLASQGEMNTFIRHRATKRKEILTNFLDLNIFDQMHSFAKEESAETKALLKNVPDRDWDTVIDKKSREKLVKTRKRDVVDENLSKMRKHMQDLKIILATHKDRDLVTEEDVQEQETRIDRTKGGLKSARKKSKQLSIEIRDIEDRTDKIDSLKAQFPVDELKERLTVQQDLEKSIVDITHLKEREQTLLKGQDRSVRKLDEVPCGDEYPTCKYIKESHKNKKLIENQKKMVDDVRDQLKAARRAMVILQKENLQEKIERYNLIMTQGNDLRVELSQKTVFLHEAETNMNRNGELLQELEDDLRDMRLRVSDRESAQEIRLLKGEMRDIQDKITNNDAVRISISENIGLLTSQIGKLEEERETYKELLSQWRTYDLFMNAVSKKGIPLRIITSQLPSINAEISKILQDVVGFTVRMEADPGTNAMDISIDYGDSTRVIECASGMEKMMASLAIRVALINVSSLPKTDLLIIDEGFGALDEMNVEACNRLLESLKRWFRNILVISHVDAVKDAVDNVLVIGKKGKDAMVRCDGDDWYDRA